MIQDIGVLALQVAKLSDRIQVRKIEGITLGPVAGVPLHTQAGNFLFDRARLQFIYHSGKVAVILRNGKHGIADAQAEAEMYISGDNCIEIEQVTVYCTDPAAAEPLLTDCLGKEVKIHVETAS